MKKITAIGLSISLILIVILSFPAPLSAQESLVQTYAPIFYFEKEETCYPVDIDYHISNSYLYQIDTINPIDQSPTAESISNYTDTSYYLDNIKGTIDDNGIINDYQSQNRGYTIYAHIIESGSNSIIHYWMFYAFNKGTLNQHEGDWEMVQIILSDGTPTHVMYSQHYSGQRATWDQVEKEGNHFKVYVARGSHANYLRSYSGVISLANDRVGANGKILQPNDYDIVLLESQPWLNYAGLWGWAGTTEEEATASSLLGQNGPPGPQHREDGLMWNGATWGDSLIPADNTIFILEFVLYNIVTIFIIISLIIIALLLNRLYKQYKTTGLGPRFLSILYIDGLNPKSIGNILCIAGIIIAFIALIQPWYLISTNITISGYETEGLVEMMSIDGINGLQIQIPGFTGPMPLGSISIPFSLFIGISLVFLIIATIGVSESTRLGKKYIFRGIRLLIPVVIIILIIMMLGAIPFSELADTADASIDIDQVVQSISGSPFRGQQVVTIPQTSGNIDFRWGLGLGGILLLLSGITLIIAGLMEQIAKTDLFSQGKTITPPKESKKKD